MAKLILFAVWFYAVLVASSIGIDLMPLGGVLAVVLMCGVAVCVNMVYRRLR